MLMSWFMQASTEDEVYTRAPLEEQPDHESATPQHQHRRWLTVVQSLTLITVLLLSAYNHALLNRTPEGTVATPWLVQSEPFQSEPPLQRRRVSNSHGL